MSHAEVCHISWCSSLLFPLSPPLPLSCFQLIPTRSSLIGPIIGSGVANSAEIIGCWETKGGLEVLKGGLGRVRCAWRATRKLVCQSEMNFSPYVELFSPPPPPPHLLIFFGGPGLGLRGSGWVCFLWQRQVSKCSVFESERGKERGKKKPSTTWIQLWGPQLPSMSTIIRKKTSQAMHFIIIFFYMA